jgi:hypothetical protein
VIPVNFGASGDESHEYYATILWSNVRNKIKEIEIPDNSELIEELSMRRYKITTTGKERIEPKAEFKAEFHRSPDSADALILAFANTVSRSKVIKDFDHLDKNTVFNIREKGYIGINGEKFCSIFQSKDRRFHIIYSLWNAGKLYITNELESNDSISFLARNIQNNGPFNRISGNDRMFGEFKEDVSSQFRKYNVSIYENYRYDEAGAIECLNIMVKSKRLIINDSCSALINQLRKWSFEKNISNQEVDFGMCYSLLNIVSELKEKIIPREIIKPFLTYGTDREKAITNINKPHVSKKNKWQSW